MTIQNYWNSTYNFITDYASYGYNNSVTWIKTTSSQLYAKLPEIGAIAKRHLINAFYVGKDFLWTHKEWVVGGVIIGVALWALYSYLKNRPQYPIANLETCLNVGKLSISTLN
jgi:hypothetical protein